MRHLRFSRKALVTGGPARPVTGTRRFAAPQNVVTVSDVISQFRSATEAGDVGGFMRLLHPQAELVSPIFGRLIIRGERDLQTLFTAVYGSVKNLRWVDQVGDERLVLLRGEARIGPTRLDDAMLLELGPDQRI